METKNSLTEQEKAAGILTAEVMWKMGRVGGSVLSPDGRTVLYTVTRYDMEQNKGTTDIWSVPAGGGKAVRVTIPAATSRRSGGAPTERKSIFCPTARVVVRFGRPRPAGTIWLR